MLGIGNYTFSGSHDHNYSISFNRLAVRSGTDIKIKSYDHVLHQSLDKIFRERCLGSSDRIKEFIRGPRHRTEPKCIIKTILERFPKGDFRKLSLLWIAVLSCCEKSAELLVRSGADVSELFGRRDPQVIDEKWTVLHVLLQMKPSPKNERLIRLVIDHGADLLARDHKGRTVLHIAVRRNRVQLVEMLLEKGACVNAADNNGVTPLLIAVMGDTNELVLLLMKHGADVFAKDSKGYNACYYLTYSTLEHVELARVLIEKGVSLKENTNDNSQAIHLAATYGMNELVKLFLDYGANVNAQNVSGRCPLYCAAQFGQNAVMKTLLKRGANVKLKTIKGRTALHAACENAVTALKLFEDDKFESAIKLLLSAGADVLVQDLYGKTPFALMPSTNNVRQPETRLMIKVLALIKVLQPSIELQDERIIERFSKMRSYYRECLEEIDRMKLTGFIETCTLFELLTKSQCQIAALMQNPEFESKFRLYDLNGFSIYAEFLLPAFERAQKHYHAMLKQENVINEAFYDMLPYLIVKKVIRYIFNDCCSDNVMKFNKIFE